MSLDYSQQYAKYHPPTHAHRHGLRLLHRRVIAPHLPADRHAAILDVGCGRGYLLQDLAAEGYDRLQGIEIDAGQAGLARGQGLAVEHVADSPDWLRARPGAFAAILLLDVLEHIPTPDQPDLLRAAAEALAPGGVLVCRVPNAASAIAPYWRYNDYTHLRSFTDHSLGFLLEQCGFREVRYAAEEIFPRPRFLFWLPTRRASAWWLRVLLRLRQRAEFIAELGWDRGRQVILTPNLVAVAVKSA